MTTVQSGPQTIETRIGRLEFTHDFANGYPTDATVQKLYDERDFQRACQAYLWALPAVSFTAWQRGINGLGARNGQIVAVLSYEARRGILTANATTPYYLGFADLSDGPLIMIIPPQGVQGGISDGWQITIGFREQLDPDRARQELVRVLPLLPAHRAVLRSLVAAAGLRASLERAGSRTGRGVGTGLSREPTVSIRRSSPGRVVRSAAQRGTARSR
jgi:uncharacterized protein DUF1254